MNEKIFKILFSYIQNILVLEETPMMYNVNERLYKYAKAGIQNS